MRSMETVSFEDVGLDFSWAFEDENTRYLTHDIHRYPAKFIPQLARRIIETYSKLGDYILDPFCGSGSALLEARLVGRNAIGVDINPVAVIVSKVKCDPISPTELVEYWDEFKKGISPLFMWNQVEPYIIESPALKSWIPEAQLVDLGKIFRLIKEVRNERFRNFLLVAFSNIQKDCSWWLMKSIKPSHNWDKKVPDARTTFIKQVQKMIKKNNQLWEKLKGTNTQLKVYESDARILSSLFKEDIALSIFSPPYVTSYEYVDIHKLSIIWLKEVPELNNIKRKFIGSTLSNARDLDIESPTALKIVEDLQQKDKSLSNSVRAYFQDMQKSFEEIDKKLLLNGFVSIVIGNTKLRKVEIKNAEVFAEMFNAMGYRKEKIIKRPIPSKNLPSTRDPKTGKFTSTTEKHVKAYPHEYILIFRKGR
ncbi:MAG: DNA methyltransferase [Candidatus Jordarchaeaceae archaeon]